MQKIRVIQAFVDAALEPHAPGEVIEVDDRLATELMATGIAERATNHPSQPEACVKPDCCRAVKKGAKA